jgi:flagellar biosynthesis protein FlhG
MKSLKSQNYYEILGVTRDASPEEVRKAFEIAKQTFQQNSLATYSLFTDEENQEILAVITRAYETLFTPALRREYDAFLDGLEAKGHPARERRIPPSPPGPPSRPGPVLPQRDKPAPLGRPRVELGPLREATGAATGGEAPPAERKEEAMEDYLRSVGAFNGGVLKKVRQLRGLSIDDIADRTKIRKTYIQYIEEEQFDFLPAPVYVKGFITLIAGLLELPSQRVAEDYMQTYRAGRRA